MWVTSQRIRNQIQFQTFSDTITCSFLFILQGRGPFTWYLTAYTVEIRQKPVVCLTPEVFLPKCNGFTISSAISAAAAAVVADTAAGGCMFSGKGLGNFCTGETWEDSSGHSRNSTLIRHKGRKPPVENHLRRCRSLRKKSKMNHPIALRCFEKWTALN